MRRKTKRDAQKVERKTARDAKHRAARDAERKAARNTRMKEELDAKNAREAESLDNFKLMLDKVMKKPVSDLPKEAEAEDKRAAYEANVHSWLEDMSNLMS